LFSVIALLKCFCSLQRKVTEVLQDVTVPISAALAAVVLRGN
jgi:hypothetical protein